MRSRAADAVRDITAMRLWHLLAFLLLSLALWATFIVGALTICRWLRHAV